MFLLYIHKGSLDLVILNTTENPELKYSIIRDGILIYEVEPFKTIAEPQILNKSDAPEKIEAVVR